MPNKAEPKYAGEFLASEAPGQLSHDVITILSGNVVNPGDVLGKITASGKYVAYAPAANDGSQNAIAVAYAKIDATAADATGPAITREAEVNGAELGWGAANGGQITAGIASLATKNIIVRLGSV